MKSPALDQGKITPFTDSAQQTNAKREFWLTVAALTALYAVVVAVGSRRYVWFDELFTFDIARSASLHELWYRVLRFDCNPPTVYVLSRISMSIFGPTPLALRLPSILEFYFGSLAIMVYVRRKAGTAFAAVAVLMLWAAGPTLYYAVEARAYALLFLGFACLLLSWDTAIHKTSRGLALVGVSVSTLALAGAHVFAPFTLFAFIVAEIVRLRRRRRPDYRLWAALLVPMLSMLLYIPLIRLYGESSFPPQLPTTRSSLSSETPSTLQSWDSSFWRRFGSVAPGKSNQEATFLSRRDCITCMHVSESDPVESGLMRRHGMFYNRYCVTSQVAILASLAIFLAYRVGFNRLAAYAAAAVLLLAILKLQVWHPLLYPLPQGLAPWHPCSPTYRSWLPRVRYLWR